jgi:hypothetical protein
MPTVAAVPPPKPAVPAVPARLLASASAPALAITPEADPGYQDCLAALAVMSDNPEDDPGYRESWDAYWARVRPQRNRPYDKPPKGSFRHFPVAIFPVTVEFSVFSSFVFPGS